MNKKSNQQCVILIGGLGTRLGDAVKQTPKPMLDIAGKPFVMHLIKELSRFGINNILLLAGYKADIVQEYFDTPDFFSNELPSNVKIKVITEQSLLGTAGALLAAKDHLEESFFLCNGDSYFDCNILELSLPFKSETTLMRMGLKPVLENSRYGQVICQDDFVQSFKERDQNASKGFMNTGIYFMHKKILDKITDLPCSLEQKIFPLLAENGQMEQHTFDDAYFIDIGILEDLEKARQSLLQNFHRPAVFFDRDGVLNVDKGHTHRPADLEWIEGAKETIKFYNNKGYYVFVVTNQAGIAKGLYTQEQMHAFHIRMQGELNAIGAHIDAFTFCPHHSEGVVADLSYACDCRKPKPKMIIDLLETWDISKDRSFLIGDKQSDIQAAEEAGIHGYLFKEKSLWNFTQTAILTL